MMPGFFELIIIAATIALSVLPFFFITKKTGHHPLLSLLIVIPLINIAFIFFLAFSEWPIEHELNQVKMKHRAG